VKGTKKRFLGWIGHALKRGVINIPHYTQATPWKVPTGYQQVRDLTATPPLESQSSTAIA
jgi:hypothetical protein